MAVERSMRDRDWFILLTTAQDTLHICRTMNEQGFEAWAPTFLKPHPFPRHKLPPMTKALLPGFVFVRVPHMVDVLDIAHSGRPHRHRRFRVLSPRCSIATITDARLDGLRSREMEAAPKEVRAAAFEPGRRVKAMRGTSYTGMVGKVERCGSKWTLVLFDGGNRAMEIKTSLLKEEEVSSPPKDERAPRHRNAVKYLRRAA